MRTKMFLNSTHTSNRGITKAVSRPLHQNKPNIPSLFFEELIVLGIFGIATIKHILKDGEKRRMTQAELEKPLSIKQAASDKADMARAVDMRKALEKTALNECKNYSPSMLYSKGHD